MRARRRYSVSRGGPPAPTPTGGDSPTPGGGPPTPGGGPPTPGGGPPAPGGPPTPAGGRPALVMYSAQISTVIVSEPRERAKSSNAARDIRCFASSGRCAAPRAQRSQKL